MRSKTVILAIPTSLMLAFIVSLAAFNFPFNKTSAQGPPPCTPPPADLVSWWPGDGDATDFQGNNDGMLQGDATFAAAKVDQGFSFDGDGDFVEVPDDPSLDAGTGDFSIDAWIQTSSTNLQAIVDKRTQPMAGTFFGYSLFISSGTLGVQLSDGTFSNFISGANVADGMPHFVAVTVDRDSTTGGVLYVDGTAVLTFDPTARPGSLDNDANFRIGANSPNTGADAFFSGLVDEVEYFSRALTLTEIQDIFNADTSGKCKCGGITCPENIMVGNDPGQCGAVVTFADPTPIGTGCGAITCTPPSNSFFPVGVTVVSCTAENDTSNNCPPSTITGVLGSGSPDWPSVSGNQLGRLNRNGIASSCANPKTCQLFTASGNRAFDAYTFTNNTGSTACIMVTLNVLEQTNSNYQVNAYLGTYDPANICTNYLADPGASSGIPPTPIAMSFNVPAGADFVLAVHTTNPGEIGGDYELILSGDEFCAPGCSFTVTVNDTEPPSITCPPNAVRPNDPGQCGAVVNFVASANDNCDGSITPICMPASGSFFPVGTTTVTCTATDMAGNSSNCNFTVTVNDTEAPIIVCPNNIVITTPAVGNPCVVVNFDDPVIADNCPGATVVCNPPSGTCFPLGTTTVTCTVTDAAGNSNQCQFVVSSFDVCIEDDATPGNVLLFVSTGPAKGDYLICCGGMGPLTGRGMVSIKNGVINLTHFIPSRRVAGFLYMNQLRGSASLQLPPSQFPCLITDSNTTNNSCSCGVGAK